MFNKTIWPLVILFLAIALVVLIFRNFLQSNGIDWQVVSGGNLIIYIITIVSLHLLTKGLTASNTPKFLGNAFGGILFKLMACAIAAFIYIFIARKDINKAGLFICMGLYLVYSFVEMKIIMKQTKELNDGRK
jgi:hypothetical protein